jgi:hypothetical protein
MANRQYPTEVLTEIVVRASGEAEITRQTSVTELLQEQSFFNKRACEQKGKTRARADEMEAQRGARPNLSPKLSKEDPKTATARLDQPLVAAEIPNEPPQSPELRNTDA